MRLRPSFSSIAFRLFLLVMTAQAALFGVFLLLIQESGDEAVRAGEDSTFRLLGDTVRWSIEDDLAGAKLSIASMVADEKVKAFVAARDREGLRAYLDPFYANIADRVIRLHFHLPDGTSFLRMHDPSSYGDAIARSRPLIARALGMRSTETGIELGRDGLGLRVVSPLFAGKTFLGVVEFGMEFGERFLSRLKEKYEGDYYIFLFDGDRPPRIVAGTRPGERCPLAEGNLDRLRTGEPVWSLDCSKARAVGLYPFTDFQGKAIGFVKAELTRIPLAEAMRDIRLRLNILGVVLLVIMSISLALAMNALLRPLNRVVAQTKTISRRIIDGDVSFRGDVSEATEDFQPIIAAVNDIISALRERETLLQAIVEGIPGVVFYVDSDMRVQWANIRALEVDRSIVGRDLKTSPSGFFAQESELLARAFSTCEPQTMEACYLDAEGSAPVCWEHVAVPVRDENGTASHVIRISSDVSARRRAEAELRRLNEDLEHRVEEEVRLRQEGERIADQQSRLAAIGELATGMAHEITQPLNAITFSFENLRTRFDSGTIDKAYFESKASAVGEDIERIRRVIDHVRLFARSAPEEYRVSFAPGAVVESALTLLGVQMATHGIDVSKDLDQATGLVEGNPFKYEQVVLNLLSNACDAIEERLRTQIESGSVDPAPGRLDLRLREDDRQVTLEIEDNGTGIAEKDRARVFDPFFSTKPPGKGTGLGLSISFGIIRDMSGSIELQPAPRNPGTVAVVRLPLAAREGTA